MSMELKDRGRNGERYTLKGGGKDIGEEGRTPGQRGDPGTADAWVVPQKPNKDRSSLLSCFPWGILVMAETLWKSLRIGSQSVIL